MNPTPAPSPKSRSAQRRWRGAARFIDDTALLHSRATLWAMVGLMGAVPLAAVGLLVLAAGSVGEFSKDAALALLLGEPLLLVALVAWDLRSPRQGARRFALAIGIANGGFLILLGAMTGHLFMAPLGAASAIGVALGLLGRRPRRGGVLAAWAIAGAVVGGSAWMLHAGSSAATSGAEAMKGGHWVKAGEDLERAWALMAWKGAGASERAVVATRRAEAALRAGHASVAWEWIGRIESIAPRLPLAPEVAQNELRLMDTLAWRIRWSALERLRVSAYMMLAWGERDGWLADSDDSRIDVLRGVQVTGVDRIGWAAALLDSGSRDVVSAKQTP